MIGLFVEPAGSCDAFCCSKGCVASVIMLNLLEGDDELTRGHAERQEA